MSSLTALLAKLHVNCLRADNATARHVLVLYDRSLFYIGDVCRAVAYLRKVRRFYPNAYIQLNTAEVGSYASVAAIVQNNENVDSYTNLGWHKLSFHHYDVVIAGCVPEEQFSNFLLAKYGQEITNGTFNTAIFTAHGIVPYEERLVEPSTFPAHHDLIAMKLSDAAERSMRANEIYISEAEKRWSEDWLRRAGLSENESLRIFIDDAGMREKLLRVADYFEIVSKFVDTPRKKILIFDEKRIGKKQFYREWLGEQLARNLIFAEGLSLRNAIVLMGSARVRFVFGPSTGLLHCASGAFNIMLKKGLISSIPTMIAYVGETTANYDEEFWWGGSYVDAILPVMSESSHVEVRSIRSMDYKKIKRDGTIMSCGHYTARNILQYIESAYGDSQI